MPISSPGFDVRSMAFMSDASQTSRSSLFERFLGPWQGIGRFLLTRFSYGLTVFVSLNGTRRGDTGRVSSSRTGRRRATGSGSERRLNYESCRPGQGDRSLVSATPRLWAIGARLRGCAFRVGRQHLRMLPHVHSPLSIESLSCSGRQSRERCVERSGP